MSKLLPPSSLVHACVCVFPESFFHGVCLRETTRERERESCETQLEVEEEAALREAAPTIGIRASSIHGGSGDGDAVDSM